MDLRELESYRLSDAIKFNERLNPKLWGSNEHLLPEVKSKLLAIADDFREFLGISDLDIKDITVSGSNAAYTYTPHSDIDLHLVVDSPRMREDDVYKELFNAKKYQYNDQHNFKIGDYDIELYVQPSGEPHHSQGIYSLMHDNWVRVPSRRKPEVNDISVKSKYEDIGQRIDSAIASGDRGRLDAVARKVKDMRQAGLDQHGEFGPENLAFKILRNNGTLEKLHQARQAAKDHEMSLDEEEKSKNKKPKTWGSFGGMWFPGYGYYTSDTSENPDSFDDGVQESAEKPTPDVAQMIKQFVQFAVPRIELKKVPKIKLKRDPAWSQRNSTFGRYEPDENTLYLSVADRHPLDVMRTLAHELTHHRQSELEHIPNNAGDTGSRWENEANAAAGILMRDFGAAHPEYFGDGELDEGWREKAAGLAAAACIAGTPGCATTQGSADALRNIQTVGRTAQSMKQMGTAGARDELIQQFKNQLNRGTGRNESVKEATGFIPTDSKLAHDPRYIMGLTVDIKPGETQRQARKLGWNIDKNGNPPLLMKRLEESLQLIKEGREEELNEAMLLEVAMSPSALRNWAASPEAQGIRAGFEAELIFRDTARDDDDGDQEPDYDYDERAESIEGVIDFFSNDDYGFGLSPRGERELRNELYEAYSEWRDEQLGDDWDSESGDYVRELMDNDIWDDDDQRAERIRNKLEEQGYDDDEIDDIMHAGDSAPTFTKLSAKQEYANEHELYQKYETAMKEAEEAYEEEVHSQGPGDEYYDRARENYFEDNAETYSEDDWFRQEYRYMSDVGNAFNLDWPYWTGTGSGGGSRSWEDIESSLARVVDGRVTVGRGYHNVTRKPGLWIIEPDGSLDPDDSDDSGLEIVSPPFPLDQALDQLNKVINWANNDADAYTNSSTGLHMGVSLPHKGGDVDYVKLILFMGDQYVIDKFDRAGNHYCASALEKLKQTQRARQQGDRSPERTVTALELIQKNLIELAQRYVQDGVGNQKYTSAHIKDGYIEFRSPGGDYLSLSNREDDALETTMLRFAHAMYIAGRPDLYRKEYAKKLYKLIGKPGDDSLKLFTQFATGNISRDELKQKWAEEVLKKDAPDEVKKSTWAIVDLNTGKDIKGMQYSGYTRAEALQSAKTKLKPGASMADFLKNYDAIDLNANTGEWAVIDRGTDEIITVVSAPTRGEATDKVYDEMNQTGHKDIYIRPYHDFEKPKKKLSRRAEIAQRIKAPKVPADQAVDNAQDSRDLQTTLQGTPQHNWAIRNRETQEIIKTFHADDYMQAFEVLRQYKQANNISPNDNSLTYGPYGRTDQPQAQQQQTGGTFSGQWKVLSRAGEEVYRFGGVGNNQADANRVANQWLVGQGNRFDDQGPFDVVPVMA